MLADTERRDAARRLRGIDAERLDRVYGMDGEGGECSDPDMAKAGRSLMLGAIADAVGMHFAPYYFDASPLRDRLADLIEPEPERTARLEYDEVHCDYVCTACGERTPTGVYEAVADDDRLLLKPMRYCPNCGARLVD